ncbi:hypothetical protein GCM10007036_31420 [Alsobacter metallidurans]|uniref:Uncharacterized protein n=1 Tax=Alsobacter metallidurans TaxID=340221 RepID=A0A917MKN1_9HYPH|nr:hypothetical protein GCM10007036_31420 [Alsobacter metallidurans]
MNVQSCWPNNTQPCLEFRGPVSSPERTMAYRPHRIFEEVCHCGRHRSAQEWPEGSQGGKALDARALLDSLLPARLHDNLIERQRGRTLDAGRKRFKSVERCVDLLLDRILTPVALAMLPFGILCAVIAPSRGRNALSWFAIGALTAVFGLIALLALPKLPEVGDRQ